jgi:hypothetical protein
MISTLGHVGEEMACSYLLETTRYHNGAGLLPNINDYIFIDAALSTAFVGGDKFYAIANGKTIQIDDNGKVTDTYLCGGG